MSAVGTDSARQLHKLNVSHVLDDPRVIAVQNFLTWGKLVGVTSDVHFEIDGPARQLMRRIDHPIADLYIKRSIGGGAYTTNPLIGILAPMAARTHMSGSPRVWRLCWVEKYLRELCEHSCRVAKLDRECVLNEGRGKAEIWRYVSKSVRSAVESAMRYALHGAIDRVPPDIRLAMGYGWAQAALGDKGYCGDHCENEAKKFARMTLRHYSPVGSNSGVQEMVWRPLIECVLTNLVVRFAGDYHNLSGLTFSEKLIMRQVDIGSYSTLYPSAHYGGYADEENLDEWCVAMAMLHEMWQLRHDEKKRDDNLNTCSLLLRAGITTRELGDYITYILCSTEVPADLLRVVCCFGPLTMTSARVSVHAAIAKGTVSSEEVGSREGGAVPFKAAVQAAVR